MMINDDDGDVGDDDNNNNNMKYFALSSNYGKNIVQYHIATVNKWS